MDRFEQLLRELGEIINVPLHPDKRRACKLNINNVLHIQLECDEFKEKMLMATFIHDIPPGKYRENLLKEALKANGLYPHTSTFAYSERNNKLALFEYLFLQNLTGGKIADALANLIEKAEIWRLAIERGTLPMASESEVKADRSIFGLKL
jgi:hypothetical protein